MPICSDANFRRPSVHSPLQWLLGEPFWKFRQKSTYAAQGYWDHTCTECEQSAYRQSWLTRAAFRCLLAAIHSLIRSRLPRLPSPSLAPVTLQQSYGSVQSHLVLPENRNYVIILKGFCSLECVPRQVKCYMCPWTQWRIKCVQLNVSWSFAGAEQ